uniref:Uncharacterized protein n=1 Tax=Noctiluca scintillans TaxID=2966 RepID=A0A7S0ZQI5_NOCSC|mmetsp:Transcript_14563/g.40014  ORF Transcript_14563/g.40014 Transcript_14563/m.40014 type:complete len:123 (+) Transcript_14563:109-477(+)
MGGIVCCVEPALDDNAVTVTGIDAGELEEESPKAAPTGMSISFRDLDGTERTFLFTSRPFGLIFSDIPPFKVVKCREQALGFGIGRDWQVTAIGGDDVHGLNSDDLRDLIRKHGKRHRPQEL